MISTTLMVNGATVYIIGLEQVALDKWASFLTLPSVCTNQRDTGRRMLLMKPQRTFLDRERLLEFRVISLSRKTPHV